jgi:hypothetical protein
MCVCASMCVVCKSLMLYCCCFTALLLFYHLQTHSRGSGLGRHCRRWRKVAHALLLLLTCFTAAAYMLYCCCVTAVLPLYCRHRRRVAAAYMLYCCCFTALLHTDTFERQRAGKTLKAMEKSLMSWETDANETLNDWQVALLLLLYCCCFTVVYSCVTAATGETDSSERKKNLCVCICMI